MAYQKMETYYSADRENMTCDIYVEHDPAQSLYGPVTSRAKRAMKDIIPVVALELTLLEINLVGDMQPHYSCKDFEVPEGRTLTRFRYDVVSN